MQNLQNNKKRILKIKSDNALRELAKYVNEIEKIIKSIKK